MPHAGPQERSASATILAVEQHGASPGGSPFAFDGTYRLTLRVEPEAEPSFEARIDAGAHELLAPAEGDRLSVRCEGRDPATVTLSTTSCAHPGRGASPDPDDAEDLVELVRARALRESGALTEAQLEELEAKLPRP